MTPKYISFLIELLALIEKHNAEINDGSIYIAGEFTPAYLRDITAEEIKQALDQ